ncbi:SGNH/GDSL hydrolase family protein [Streptomyces celluloflavus]|uniref:SGNH/GDSL hydrolase family protein n=1 Tax=Streptomyces celluloflavus TaxID=58344 RepID=UPI00379A4A1F
MLVAGALIAGAVSPATAATDRTADTAIATGGNDGRGERNPPAPRQDQSSKVLSPGSVLPKAWKQSADRAVTVAGDGSGLHVLAADSRQAYQWRTVATLSEPAFSTDLWIGNACVTGSGKHAVVVYAPREFTNRPALMERGGFAAVVDLTSGKVAKLAQTVTLAYFNPGCGTGESAVLTQMGDEKANETRLLTLDTVSGAVIRRQTEKVQVTSAVPVGDTIVGAASGRLISFDRTNRATELATTSGPAFQLRADREGGVSFLDRVGGKARARRSAMGHTTTFAQGPLGSLGLAAEATGRVFLTGTPTHTFQLPDVVRILKVAPDATASSTGALAVDRAVPANLRSHGIHPLATTAWNTAAPLRITAEVPATGKKISFTAGQDPTTRNASGMVVSPALTGSSPGSHAKSTVVVAAAGDPNSTIDTDRTCSQPRNDPGQQAYQPTPNQVEWAADMAIRGNLTSTYVRQGDWRTADGLGTVNPQGMFPLPALTGTSAGRIPAQVLLGVLAQESNLWQAEGGALPGQSSSTLASTNGFYGHPNNPTTPDDHWLINWAKADCGYGIGQQTDGMKFGDVDELPAAQQKAIALDYTSNIAAAAQTLAKKWNELHDNAISPGGIKLNTDDPAAPENWFAALWDYNSGLNYYVPAKPSEPWGLGWLNNPSNPLYPPDRHAFLDNNTYADAAHPERWPYEEKVLGWGAWPIDTGRAYADDGTSNNTNTAGFSPAWWSSNADRSTVKPDLDTFCKTDVNTCDPASPPRCEVDHQGPDCDPPHWYHAAQSTWKVGCASSCGHEYLTYKTLKPELGNGNNGSGHMCDNAVPSGALVVDDVASTVPAMTDGCSKSAWSNYGSFSFSPFQADSQNHYEAKGDLHQIGGGFGDHFWYAHTRNSEHRIDLMKVTGTWTLNKTLNQWARVFVHLPDTGAQTQQAHYQVSGLTDGGTRDRYLNHHYRANTWVPLGVYRFNGTPRVSLSNETDDGTADDDIAWDAVAFQPLPSKPKHMVVAMGDSYTSGEGAGDYSTESDTSHGTPQWNACSRSANSWSRKMLLPFTSHTVGDLADSNDASLDFQNVSCSGAHTWQLTSGNPGQWGLIGNFHEKTQIDSGALSPDTTLVMLTIGGNDGDNFTNAITHCYVIGVCDQGAYTGNVDTAVEATGSVIGQIASAAPNAQIVLMDYPHIVNNAPCWAGNFDALNYLANYVRDKQKAKVDELNKAGTKVAFADAIPAFNGHGLCDNDEWINGIVAGPNGDGDYHKGDPANQIPCIPVSKDGICASLESFHPKGAGTTAYAQTMNQKLFDLGYQGN